MEALEIPMIAGQQTIYDQLNPGPTHGSLFSGYGGIDLALEEVFGARTVWVSDIDPGACTVLDRRFPEAENLGDITQIPWEDVPRVDILSGGSPCQDLSAAGRRAGMTEGTRSNLWVQMREAIATLRPKLVVWENVMGALSARATSELESIEGRVGGGAGRPVLRALGRVLGDLAEIGFDAEWATVRASDVGAPHGRARVFLVAWPEGSSPHALCGGGGRWSSESGQAGGDDEAVGSDSGGDGGRRDPVALLPTPRVSSGNGPSERELREGNPKTRLETSVALLPTPKAGDADFGLPRTSGRPPERSTHLATRLHYTIGEGRASTSETGSREDVRDVRGGDDSEAVRETAGGPNSIPGEEDLLSGLWQHACGSDEECPSLESQEGDTAGRVRGMRDHTGAARASQGPQPGEQHHVEPDGPVRFVPSTAALGGGSREESGRDQECGGSPWGAYAPAIRRWEAVTGRLAPDPTIPSPRTGKPQLSPLLVEWMMGLPAGWVTDPDLGLSRVQQLKALGNGVVPQQAAHTLRSLVARAESLEVAA